MDVKGKEELERKADDGEPFSALAFKIMSDPHVGKLTYFRVYSGTLDKGDQVLNTRTTNKERIGRLLQMHANHREDMDAVFAGDIVAAIGLKDTKTGDTLCDPEHPIVLEALEFPEPVIHVAVEPKTKADQDKMGKALAALSEEDPTFQVRTDEETGQTVISGMGELHLEILVDRMLREFRVDANVGKPQVAYRETITNAGQQGRVPPRQADRRQGPVRPRGHRPRAHRPRRRLRVHRQDHRRAHPEGVHPRGRPGHPGGAHRRRARRLPDRRRPGHPHRRLVPRRRLVGDGVQDRRLDGVEGGAPARRSRCCSSRSCRSRSVTPDEYMGDVIGDLNRRRGRVGGIEQRGNSQVIRAQVPLSEMFGYATDLRSRTQGRATYTMQFDSYQQTPASVQDEIVVGSAASSSFRHSVQISERFEESWVRRSLSGRSLI